MFQSLINSVVVLLEQAGGFAYLILFLVAFLERAAFLGIIIPGGYIVLIAGFLTTQGYLHLFQSIPTIISGAMAGDCLGYGMGRKFGRGYFKRHRRLFLLKQRHVELAEKYFKKQGGRTILIGRFVSVIHMVIPFVAGMSRMVFRRFFVFDLAGNFIWALVFTSLGYVLGWTLLRKGSWLLAVGLVFLVILGMMITSFLFHRNQAHRP